MKGTSHRILSLIMALVLVVSMFATLVAPASAAVDTVVFAPVPNVAGSTATYNVTFNTSAAGLFAGVTTISVTFTAGTTMPTSIAKESITVNGTQLAVAPIVDGLKVTLMSPVGAGAGVTAVTVVFSQLCGIKNPLLGKTTYKGTVETSLDPSAANNSAAYTISRQVTFSPARGAMNANITVTGVGFAANSSIDIGTVAGNTGAVGSGTTDANGSFTVVAAANAALPISATDGAGNSTNSATALIIDPSLAVSPTTGEVGDELTVTGSGYVAGDEIMLSIANYPVSILRYTNPATAPAQTNEAVPGELLSPFNTVTLPAGVTKFEVVVKIPSGTTAGSKVVASRDVTVVGPFANLAAFQASATAATTGATVGARTVTLSPATGQIGATVLVTASGFEGSIAGTPITANMALETPTGVALTNNLLTNNASVDGNGAFSASFAVPATGIGGAAINAGAAKIRVTSYNGAAILTQITVPFTVLAATLTISPTSGAAGSTVTLTGTGFAPYTSFANLSLDGVGNNSMVFVPTVVTDSAGAFTVTFTWAGGQPGPHQVRLGNLALPVVTFTTSAGVVGIATGLNSIAGKYTIVWAYNAATQSWMLYDTAAPAVSDLSALTKGQGYWVQVSSNCTIVYGGNSYSLLTGWNLIGWLG